jgi:hypothetical protein
LYEVDLLLERKHLRHAIGWHLICGSPLYAEAVFLDLLVDPALVDLDVLIFHTKFIQLFCDYPNVVTPNDRRLVEL